MRPENTTRSVSGSVACSRGFSFGHRAAQDHQGHRARHLGEPAVRVHLDEIGRRHHQLEHGPDLGARHDRAGIADHDLRAAAAEVLPARVRIERADVLEPVGPRGHAPRDLRDAVDALAVADVELEPAPVRPRCRLPQAVLLRAVPGAEVGHARGDEVLLAKRALGLRDQLAHVCIHDGKPSPHSSPGSRLAVGNIAATRPAALVAAPTSGAIRARSAGSRYPHVTRRNQRVTSCRCGGADDEPRCAPLPSSY